MGWGKPGKGKWITIYTNPGHVYMVVAGVRFDTSGKRSTGSRWQAHDARHRRVRRPPPAGPVAPRSVTRATAAMTIPSFDLRVVRNGRSTHIAPCGELDIATTPRARAGDRRGDGATPCAELVLDLRELTFMDSTGPARARPGQHAAPARPASRCRSGAARARSSACWRSPASARCCRSSTRRRT